MDSGHSSAMALICEFSILYFKLNVWFSSPGEFVKLCSVLRDPLCGIDDVHCGLERASAPGEVCHLHHDHAHVLGQHDDVIALVVPLAHLVDQVSNVDDR